MKKLVLLIAGAAAVYAIAKKYNINSLADLKEKVMPYLEDFLAMRSELKTA
jgi:hypothetical protein